MDINSNIQLNDSDILALEKGPVAWAKSQQGSMRNVDGFTKALAEQINRCGFSCEVKCLETNEPGTYAFEVEINGRIGGSIFDPDKQVHEVTRNILQLPGEKEGFIPSKEGMKKLFEREQAKARDKAKHNHQH